MSGQEDRSTADDRLRAQVPAGLRYVSDDDPGISRRRHGSGSSYSGEVARWLGNTPAVCRSSYIHPTVLEAYVDGGFAGGHRRSVANDEVLRPPVRHGLGADEREVLALLRRLRRSKAA